MDTEKINSYKKLEETIANQGNRPIFFVGSGLSIRYLDGPNWSRLLKELIKITSLSKTFEYFLQKYNENYEDIASELVDIFFEKAWGDVKKYDEEFYSVKYNKSVFLKLEISKIFKKLLEDLNLDENSSLINELKLFSKTNPSAIITTNYDEFLEKKIFKTFKTIVGEKIISERTKGRNGKILKIHGCVSKPETIVISKEDYENFILNQKYLSAKLLTYFIEYPLIIMGYSLSDRNILGIFETISDIKIFGNSTKKEINNIWFINYSRNNLYEIDILQEKEILLSNNKSIKINYINVRTYTKLFESIVKTNKYPYSLTAIAEEFGFSHWKQIEKYLKCVERKENIKIEKNTEYCILYKSKKDTVKRYSEKFVNKLKDIKRNYAQQCI